MKKYYYFAFLFLILSVSISTKTDRLNGTTLIVTAHPDDEMMFFGPTILNSENVYILCISSGLVSKKYKENEREKEFLNSCEVLGLKGKCFVDSKKRLKDGFNETWPEETIREIVNEYASIIKPDRILTFDSKGVSFHPNHIAVGKGVRTIHENYKLMELNTGLWITKYFNIFSLPLEQIYRLFNKKRETMIFVTPFKDILNATLPKAYFCHKSQNTWYRILYLAFSKFQFFNVCLFSNIEQN